MKLGFLYLTEGKLPVGIYLAKDPWCEVMLRIIRYWPHPIQESRGYSLIRKRPCSFQLSSSALIRNSPKIQKDICFQQYLYDLMIS